MSFFAFVPCSQLARCVYSSHIIHILLEVLRGARDEQHARLIERNLRLFPVAQMLDPVIAVEAARNYRLLRGRGVTVRKTIDMIIGTFCIRSGHTLLHEDHDFDAMVRHLGLQIA